MFYQKIVKFEINWLCNAYSSISQDFILRTEEKRLILTYFKQSLLIIETFYLISFFVQWFLRFVFLLLFVDVNVKQLENSFFSLVKVFIENEFFFILSVFFSLNHLYIKTLLFPVVLFLRYEKSTRTKISFLE